MILAKPLTLDDLARVTDKAELIRGRIVKLMPTGRKPARVGGRIYRSLDDYATQTGIGEAFPDNAGYAVPMLSSGRESFSPDASYVIASPGEDDEMRFIDGPPKLAVEVRSESDYGPSEEQELADKRADYFEAGTEVVWDVDPVAECVRVYRADLPTEPRTFLRGEKIDTAPYLPGWEIDVDWIFQPRK